MVKRTDLPAEEMLKLNAAETGIRQLELSPLATQFLLTRLHSSWKLEETNQELDTLTIQLKQPGAKEELKDLYLPVIRKTGDMHLKLNRLDKAKELYQLNISSQANDSFEKAASREGMATAYKQGGDKEEAVRNFEMAKEIYVKQGDTRAATKTEKEIANTKLQRIDNTTLPKTKMRAQSPSP
jgi:tetratricopeptide (TPR) repeat protein